MSLRRTVCTYLVLLAAICTLIQPAAAAHATSSGVTIRWNRTETLPQQSFNGLRLPMRLVTVRTNGATPTPRTTAMSTQRWNGVVARATVDVAPTDTNSLPDAPVFVVRTLIWRGVHLAVVAISPIYRDNGVAMQASSITTEIPNSTLFDSSLAGADIASITAPPQNPQAMQSAIKVQVSNVGMQQISGATLLANGASSGALGTIQVWHNGSEVALDISDNDNNGKLSPNDMLRFYAASVGDRWNANETYWLTTNGSGTAARITSVATPAGSGTALTSARQIGTWRMPTLYSSLDAGPDADHWFSLEFRAEPPVAGQPAPTPMSSTVVFTPTLPTIEGTASYSLVGASASGVHGSHALRLTTDRASSDLVWNTTGNWSQNAQLTQALPRLTLIANNTSTIDWFYVDSFVWNVPVALQFAQAGATFATEAAGSYQLGGSLPADWALYDITNPTAPTHLQLADSTGKTWQSAANRRYLLSGPGTLFSPTVSHYTPADLSAALAAQVVYVAPASFQAVLAPLIAHRQAQGYQVAVVDPQTIYDRWSYGQIAPEAIRSFFRSAYAQTGGALIAATLVGDGTSDPHDYLGWRALTPGTNQNIIPPYLAKVDLWLGETACDTCFAQLDGDSPLDDMMPDIAIGRLPVQNAEQLSGLVNKIIGYETSKFDPAIASRIGYVVDNYYQKNPDGSVVTDPAGNFSESADGMVRSQPDGTQVVRVDYDPTAPSGPTREPDATTAYERSFAIFNNGAGAVNYIGHGSPVQLASTDIYAPAGKPYYLLSLYDPDRMSNATALPVVLELTCLSSAFQTPNIRGTAIDERLVTRIGGGAIATWGSSGAGVSHGHDALQRGFYQKLWQQPRGQSRLGDLTQAGYLELLTTAASAADAARTFLLLGDPLSKAQIAPANTMYLPINQR